MCRKDEPIGKHTKSLWNGCVVPASRVSSRRHRPVDLQSVGGMSQCRDLGSNCAVCHPHLFEFRRLSITCISLEPSRLVPGSFAQGPSNHIVGSVRLVTPRAAELGFAPT